MSRALTLALAVMTVVAYLAVWDADFVYEDGNALRENIAGHVQDRLVLNDIRLGVRVLHRVEYHMWGLNPLGYHLVSLGIHLVNGLLVGSLATAFGGSAWLAAGVFWLLPIQVEAVTYVAARSDLLSTTFMLVGFLVLHRSRLQGRHVLAWIGCCVAAVLCKETSLGLVGVGLVLFWLWHPLTRETRRLAVLVGLPTLVLGAAACWWFWIVKYSPQPVPWIVNGELQSVAVTRLLGLVVVPHGLSIDHDFIAASPRIQWTTFVLLMGALIGIGAWLYRRGRDWLTESILVGLACLVFSVLPRFVLKTSEPLNEHQMYAPMVGVSLIVSVLWAAWVHRGDEERSPVYGKAPR